MKLLMKKRICGKDVKVSSQCIKVVKTANQVLDMIKRTFTFKTKEYLLQLYKSLVTPHRILYACMESLCKKNIDLLEAVQRRATQIILPYKHHCYGDMFALC